MASTIFSALESAPETISPLISTVAVWTAVGLLAGALSLRKTQNTATANTSQAIRKPIFQRRDTLASCKLEKTSFSNTCLSLAICESEVAEGVVPSFSADAPGCNTGSIVSGVGSCISKFKRFQVVLSMPVNDLMLLGQGDFHQTSSTGAACARTCHGAVSRPMCGAHQPLP